MKNIYVGILLFITIHSCMAAVSRNNNATHPDHPDKCYYKTDDVLMEPGETYYPKERCSKVVCGAPGQTSSYTCGVARVEGCKTLGHDFTKQYPDCCWAICTEYEEGYEH